MTTRRNIPFSPPDMSEAEINEVAEALRSGWITTGPRTKEFEHLISMCCQTARNAHSHYLATLQEDYVLPIRIHLNR